MKTRNKTEMKTNEDTYFTPKYLNITETNWFGQNTQYNKNILIWSKELVDKHVLKLVANYLTYYIILKHQNWNKT
jgi:hypothetical protein